MSPAPTKQSSISVAVRIRPFSSAECKNLISNPETPRFIGQGALSESKDDSEPASKPKPNGVRKIVDAVDDKMLVFDPPATNPLVSMQKNAFPNGNLKPRIRDYRFVFDRLLDEYCRQEDVYESTTKPLIDSVLDGYNATVFAYGATGCGKTYTILGTPEDPGVIFLTMKELYARIDALADTRIVDVSISFLEIYNESIRDLLHPETSSKKLVIREDSNQRITVSNLLSRLPTCVEDVMDLIMVGNQNRTLSPTEANAASSRSHAVLQINVTSHSRTASLDQEHTFATFSIIDLAGSERAAATKNRGATLNEGANINRSLLALGNCINALCDPRRRNHIPYRDSKLTRLLKFSLGGNCKTVMIVCISPLSQHYDETLNTLKYANRAKEIKTKVVRNRHNLDRHVGSYLKMITEQKQEIEELRARETSIIEQAISKHNTSLRGCMNEMTNSIEQLKSTLDKQHQEKWHKYFLLAKRKLLLLRQNDLNIVINFLEDPISEFHIVAERAKLLVIQARHLLSKTNQQIIHLESQYDLPSQIDQIFAKSVEFYSKKIQEHDGWDPMLMSVFQDAINSIKDYLQKDFLVNSSVLFDYLISELNSFAYLPFGFSKLITTYANHVPANEDSGGDRQCAHKMASVVNEVCEMLERMNDTEYDQAIEEAANRFMRFKSLDLTKMAPEKRGSTSPLRVSPPRESKRKPPPFNEGDVTMDESFAGKSDNEDGSPLSYRLANTAVLDDLDSDPGLGSPPSMVTSRTREHSVAPEFANKDLGLSTAQMSFLRTPLLNKQASEKILLNESKKTPLRDFDGDVFS